MAYWPKGRYMRKLGAIAGLVLSIGMANLSEGQSITYDFTGVVTYTEGDLTSVANGSTITGPIPSI
jgi:hypothetical protein